MMSAGLKFKQVFAIISWASLVQVIKWLLAIVVVFLKNPNDFDLTNPLAFNLGAFMDPTTSSKFLRTMAIALDVFAIWGIILVAIGLKAAAGKRLSFGGALFAAAAPTLLFVLLGRVGWPPCSGRSQARRAMIRAAGRLCPGSRASE